MCDGSGSGEEANSNGKICLLWDYRPFHRSPPLGLPQFKSYRCYWNPNKFPHNFPFHFVSMKPVAKVLLMVSALSSCSPCLFRDIRGHAYYFLSLYPNVQPRLSSLRQVSIAPGQAEALHQFLICKAEITLEPNWNVVRIVARIEQVKKGSFAVILPLPPPTSLRLHFSGW